MAFHELKDKVFAYRYKVWREKRGPEDIINEKMRNSKESEEFLGKQDSSKFEDIERSDIEIKTEEHYEHKRGLKLLK